jgi:hypothetical protein
MSGMNCTVEDLVRRLYQARQAASEARKARNAARAAAGDCMRQTYEHEGPCWIGKKEDWCEACAQVLPLYEAYHKASDKAGAALRLVLREGKRMSQNAPVSGGTPSAQVAGSRIFEPYDGIPCTCTEKCADPCKGGCGCRACHTAYGDFLSNE